MTVKAAVGRKRLTPRPGLQAELPAPRSRWWDFWRRYAQNPLAVLGLIIAIAWVITGIFAPWLAPYDPNEPNYNAVEQGPSLQHPLGTDDHGRDQLSRVIWGARTALIVAVSATVVGVVLGLILGAMAGYFGGWVDALVMRVADILFAFPGLLFAILVAATIQPRIETWFKQFESLKPLVKAGYVEFLVVILALSVVGWAGLARLVRGQILAVKEEEFVEAARAIGVRPWRIILRHILPNSMAPVIVALSMGMGGAILAETSLSFLGIGINPPTPSWGAMIIQNFNFWRHPMAPLLLWTPGLIVAVLILSFNFIGDGLHEALNPRLRR
jgi:ABC-type dipeptide/oligopeptide/nickel transport system permease subunit